MKEGREKLNFLGFDENVKNTLVFLKPRTILYFLLKLNSGSKPLQSVAPLSISHRNAMACCVALRHRTAPRGRYSAAIDYYD